MITKMLSVSTGHICKDTAAWLDAEAEKNASGEGGQVHVGKHYYGWFCYCHDDGMEEYPADLVRILEWARDVYDCDYINLDPAGVLHSGLPQTVNQKVEK